jgi:hypothetical protein
MYKVINMWGREKIDKFGINNDKPREPTFV